MSANEWWWLSPINDYQKEILQEIIVNWKAIIGKIVLEPKDFKNLSKFSDDQIILLVKKSLSIPFDDDITDPKHQEKISILFTKAIEIYLQTRQSVLFEEKKFKKTTLEEWRKKFSDIQNITRENIINFLRIRERWEKDSIIKGSVACLISTITKRLSGILDLFETNKTFNDTNLEKINLDIGDEQLKEVKVDKKIWLLEEIELEEIIINQLKSPLNLIENQQDPNTYSWKLPQWENFTIYWRKKTLVSMVLKWISNQDELFKIGDFWWLTVKVNSDKIDDLIKTIEYFLNIISSIDWRVENLKTKIDISAINKDNLSEKLQEFLKKLDDSTKWATNKNYKEIKINIIVWGYPVEIKFCLKWNTNQKWLAFQWIYRYLHTHALSKISYLWESYISRWDLEFWALDFIEKMRDEIEKNPETRWKITVPELKKQIIDDLIKEKYISKKEINKNAPDSTTLKVGLINYFIKKWWLIETKKDTYTTERRKEIKRIAWSLLWE